MLSRISHFVFRAPVRAFSISTAENADFRTTMLNEIKILTAKDSEQDNRAYEAITSAGFNEKILDNPLSICFQKTSGDKQFNIVINYMNCILEACNLRSVAKKDDSSSHLVKVSEEITYLFSITINKLNENKGVIADMQLKAKSNEINALKYSQDFESDLKYTLAKGQSPHSLLSYYNMIQGEVSKTFYSNLSKAGFSQNIALNLFEVATIRERKMQSRWLNDILSYFS